MARPSGECEGVPCYTQADRDEIAAELVNAQATATDAQATANVAQQDADAAAQVVMDLEQEQADAETNACP